MKERINRAPLGSRIHAVPAGISASRCSFCGLTIYWVVTKNKKNMPLDADGRYHRCAKKSR
jgi:hypothetical protein